MSRTCVVIMVRSARLPKSCCIDFADVSATLPGLPNDYLAQERADLHLDRVEVEELRQTEPRDFALLLCRDPQLLLQRVRKPSLERAEHLDGGLSGRADDENVPEPPLVVAVRDRQPLGHIARRAGNARFFLRRPLSGPRAPS